MDEVPIFTKHATNIFCRVGNPTEFVSDIEETLQHPLLEQQCFAGRISRRSLCRENGGLVWFSIYPRQQKPLHESSHHHRRRQRCTAVEAGDTLLPTSLKNCLHLLVRHQWREIWGGFPNV